MSYVNYMYVYEPRLEPDTRCLPELHQNRHLRIQVLIIAFDGIHLSDCLNKFFIDTRRKDVP